MTGVLDSARSRRTGPIAMGTAIAATTVGQLPVFLTGSLAPQIGRELDFPASSLGLAVAVFFASSALCSVTLGRLSDRFGGRTMMRWGVLPAIVSSLGIGLFVRSPVELTGALLLAGMANGAIQPAANRYLVRAVDHRRHGLAFGVKQAAIPAATLLSGLAVPALATIGWRWGFLGLAGVAACIGLVIPWRGPKPERRGRAAGGGSAPDPQFARRALIALAVGLGIGSAAVNALGSFFVSSAVHIGVSDSSAGLAAAAGSVASIVTRLVIGARADRRQAGHLRLVAALCAVGSIGVMLLALQVTWLIVIAAVIGYGAGWGWAGLFNFAVVRTHPAAPGRATGIIQTGASSGACLGPLIFAVVVDHSGYSSAWLMAAALLLVASLVILAGRRALLAARTAPPAHHG
ncbi:MAG: MFS transporter [Actinocatenispora sp.]